MDSSEINRMLGDRMQEVVYLLLPNGKAMGNKWVVGGLDGKPGDSLQITIAGSSAGRFMDFANPSDKGASPLWLWAKVKGCTYSEAIKQAADWLGVKPDDYGVKKFRQKAFSKPDKAPIRLAETNSGVMDYLTLTRRLNPIVVANSKVCETEDGTAIAFPFIEKDPETGKEVCVHRKYLKLERPDGKKDSWTTAGTKPCLYGKQTIDDNISEIVICEGEIDQLSWSSWSIPAVSIPMGVANEAWIDLDWDWLARFEKIYVSMDMDEPGQQASQVIAKRLGLHRCFIVSLPHKDANDCLVAGLDKAAMENCLKAAKPIDLDEIKRPDDFKKDVVDHYTQDPSTKGLDTPWWPALPWRVRPGEFTVWSGFSGHGKTSSLNQLMLHLIQQGCKVMDASLEVRPGLTLYYMTRCAMGKKDAKKEEAEACISWLNESLLFLDCIGVVNVDRIIHAMEYARKRHGVDVFIIDSLFKCGMSGEDYGAARAFADRLTTFCNNTNAAVILVAHSRKTQNGNEFTPPTKSDVAGSSDITNAAFNVIITWRNKQKKFKLDEARAANNFQAIAELMDQPDGKIIVDKQRFGEGEECSAVIWHDRESGQFHTTQNRKTTYFQVN